MIARGQLLIYKMIRQVRAHMQLKTINIPFSRGRAQSCNSITTPSNTDIIGGISSSTSTKGYKYNISYLDTGYRMRTRTRFPIKIKCLRFFKRL